MCAARAGHSMELHRLEKSGSQITKKLIYCADHRRFDSQEVDYNYVMVINKGQKSIEYVSKSGIHGWGPFARRNIQEGEMVPSSENYLIICMLCFSWTEMLYLSLYFSFILGNGGHDKKRQVHRFIFSNVFRFFITIKSGV
ncbi:uncharacterized protein LOC104446728 [Eucalyptus grandis]|uniref:uncharacterized protein LOC104446728 n=1 Tax=Eucalyptus grandis TaxID=71139 RepID=UPI00192ECA2F|nr:uncharacterized protein LOC104446728 [Eucalyptus grandis]